MSEAKKHTTDLKDGIAQLEHESETPAGFRKTQPLKSEENQKNNDLAN